MEGIKKFTRALRQYKRIAIDSSVFIYQFEQHPQFEPLCSHIFDLLSRRRIFLITSMITVSEILVRPFSNGNIRLIELYESVFFSLPNFSLVDIDYRLAKMASLLRSQYNILLPDAFQIAAALKLRAQVFVTNDVRLKKVKDIKVLCLKDYI